MKILKALPKARHRLGMARTFKVQCPRCKRIYYRTGHEGEILKAPGCARCQKPPPPRGPGGRFQKATP